MKRIIALVLAFACVLCLFAACTKTPATTTGSKPSTSSKPTNPTDPTDPQPPVDPWADYEIITIAEALELCEQFVEEPSADRYYIRGVITELQNADYGQMMIQDETGSILVYGAYSADGNDRYPALENKPVVGDEVLFYGNLQNYGGNTKEIKSGWIIDFIANDDGGEPDVPVVPERPDWSGYETITIAEALELCENHVDAPSTEWYYIIATVKEVQKSDYGQLLIEDETGSIMVYGSYSADGSLRYDKMPEKPVAGDEVLIYGCLQNYKGNTKEVQKGYIIDFYSGAPAVKPELPAEGSTLTIAEILELALSDAEISPRYFVRVTIDSITNPEYGAMNVSDETGTITVYGSYSADGAIGYKDLEVKPYKGDEVLLYTTVKNFKGTYELNSAWITEIKAGENNYNESDYTQMTIDEARDAATGTLVKVEGVVARITYANGMKPSGVILVDGTNSIYVYDQDVAGRVAIGNKITVLASKTYWILADETSSANKFGYKGCNQLESAWLLSNDEGSHDFDKSWIVDSSVKDIMDTPASTDITTTIFKVTALVTRVNEPGFVNYYIDDLDGVTGSYVYTQCNGSDFAWLDEFDGKICTVYLMALNAKSTSSGCVWRFLPIAVMDEGFDPSSVNVAENAVKFYGLTQFLHTYTGNPALEVLTSVNNELLGYTNAVLTYASSNESIIKFETVDGKLVMNCLDAGTATITVSCTYNGQSFSGEFEITVKEQVNVDYVDVNTAINAAVGETVIVKGIVGPSLVNKTGFYLIDETGVIAITTDADILATLEIGYEVVLQGKRDNFNTNGGIHAGQTALTSCTVVANYYGNHDYSTDSFDGTITVEEFSKLDITVDYTTSVFTMTATVEVEEAAYYTNIYLTDGTNRIILYSSNAGKQYAFLKAFAGQEITVEIAACNWNNKTGAYPGCVLSVILEDGTRIINELNFN